MSCRLGEVGKSAFFAGQEVAQRSSQTFKQGSSALAKTANGYRQKVSAAAAHAKKGKAGRDMPRIISICIGTVGIYCTRVAEPPCYLFSQNFCCGTVAVSGDRYREPTYGDYHEPVQVRGEDIEGSNEEEQQWEGNSVNDHSGDGKTVSNAQSSVCLVM